jgi:hypothetical protein
MESRKEQEEKARATIFLRPTIRRLKWRVKHR